MTRTRLILYPALLGFTALLIYHGCSVAPDLLAVSGLR